MKSLLTALFLAACPVAASAAQDDGTLISADFSDLSERWHAAAESLGVPGAGITIVWRGEVVHREALGLRDVERGLPATVDSMFYIASATKPYVAMAVSLLAEEGKLELDAPVKRYLPRFQLANAEATETVTVRDLLCHQPGINSGPIVFLDAYTGEITEDRYYHFLAQVEPTGEVTYTNVHFTLAGRVIEAVSGKPWREFLRERIFEPAGMKHTTGYTTWMYAQEDVALPTLYDGQAFELSPVRKSDETMHAAGGLGTSARDLGRWLLLNLERGRLDREQIVPRAAVERMFEMQSTLPRPDGWLRKMEGFGLGWGRGTYRGQTYLRHGGGYVGSTSYVSFLPDLGLGVAVVANTDAPGQAFAAVVSIDVYDRVLEDDSSYDPLPGFTDQARSFLERSGSGEPTENAPVTGPELSLEPASYARDYSNEHWGTLKVRVEEDRLACSLGHLQARMFARGEDRFEAWSPGALSSPGHFVVSGGAVEAVVLQMQNGESVRFE